jgi:predicted alpha/beta superfamily hydrolase
MINEIIDSIENENIPNYEIIIVGESKIVRENTKIIPFNETIRRAWITKKKNIITQESKYENIVYLHDYVKLNDGWYNGQISSGNDFKIRMDKIINLNGERFRDWCIWPHNNNKMDNFIGRDCLIPYDIIHLSKYMYISGSYWIAKKNVMLEFPLNENLTWGEGEDVLWSKQVREKYEFTMNTNSSVKIMKKNKDRVFDEPNQEKITKLNILK